MSKATLFHLSAMFCAIFFLNGTSQVLAQNAIVQKGTANATIYLQADAPDSVKLAATELQSHIKLVSGAELPISSDAAQLKGFVIYLGDTAFARLHGINADKLPHDGFRILSGANWLIVAGKDYNGPPMTGFNNPYRINESYNPQLKISAFGDAGTLFGAYHFLEKVCGVRWYMPGPLGTVAPRSQTVTVPKLDVRRAPTFEHRHAYYGFMERSNDDALWYRRAGYGTPAPVQISHSFGQFFIQYKDTHPEYFALIDGRRDFTNLSTVVGPGNLNLSNPGLIQQAITDIGKYFDENPQQKIYPLVPNDGMARISEDPQSQAQLDKTRGDAGLFSNYVWNFINTVAKGVAKTHPDKYVGCIAYEKYSLPPSNIARLSPNVVVVITKQRSNFANAQIKRDTQAMMRAWSKKASTIYNWEYYCNPLFNPNWRGYPMFFPGILQDDLRFLKGISKGEFIEAESWLPDQYGTAPEKIRINEPGLMHPLLYLTARLLWEPNLDTKALLSEYYRLFYGPAQAPMRRFWETVETNWNQKSFQMSPSQVYERETINQLLDSLREAKEAAPADSDYRKRVDLIWNEFSPAAQVAARLQTVSKPSVIAPKLPNDATPEVLATHGPLLQLLDRSYSIAAPATNVHAGWDAQNFYIDLRAYEPNMAKLKALASTRDSIEPRVWEDDSAEIFLSPDGGKTTLHFIINAAGALFDSKITGEGLIETYGWNGNARVVVRKEAARWIAQLSVPWKDLGVANPQKGQKLLTNFYRNRYAGGALEQASWSPLMTGRYFSPPDFGTLTLDDQTPQNASDNPVTLSPVGAENYGSGASLQSFYSPGGVPNVGLFLGQPNPLTRNDRAVFRFDLRPLLELRGIEKIELVFSVSGIVGPKATRTLEVQHLRQPNEQLVDALSTNDAENVTQLSVAANDANKTQRVDVTAILNKELSQGHAATIFRFRDVDAEREGNPNLQPAGISISQQTLPAIVVTLKK